MTEPGDPGARRAETVHPRHGIHEPTRSTPIRRPNSVRRTASTEILRTDGLTGPLHLIGAARDLRTAGDGTPEVLGTAATHAVVDYTHGCTVLELDGAGPAGAALVGRGSRSGFRAAVQEAFGADARDCTPLHLLLDDVPVCVLISGHVVAATAADPAEVWDGDEGDGSLAVLTARADQCAGFATGGTIMSEAAGTGYAPTVVGPAAPALEREDDPWSWHDVPELPPTGMRRRRRLDLTRVAGGYEVDAMFRDSYALPDGGETVIHEYTIEAAVDTALTVTELTSTARVLPWIECPAAATSGQRVIGRPVTELRSWVRAELVGTSTCTHLNDALRSLQDVAALASALDGPAAPSD
ncbi:DUF2889 domain-containing protein [Jatrophihabitans fulvus]